MSDITVSSFPDVRERARELGLPQVDGLALLPINFEHSSPDGLVVDQEATTLRKVLQQGGVEVQVVGAGDRPLTSVSKSADWVLPTVFVGAGLWSQNPIAVQMAFDVISSYVTDALRGTRAGQTVKLSVAVEKTSERTTKLLTYEGPANGLSSIPAAVKELAGGE